MADEKFYPLKILVVSDGVTGKTTFLRRLTCGQFFHDTKITIGIDFQNLSYPPFYLRIFRAIEFQ